MNGKASLLEAANACDRAAAAVGTEAEMVEVMRVLRHREAMQIVLTNAKVNRVATTAMRQKELLPLREGGDDYARVEARIPRGLLYGLMHQKNFGYDGFMSDEGLRDFAKSYPQFMVKTVSGKKVFGYRGRSRKSRVNFGRGTMTFAP